MADAFPFRHLCGWVDDPRRYAVAKTFAPPLSQAAPWIMATPVENAMLYKAWKDTLGAYPSYVAQQIGDCTSFGSGHCNDLIQSVEMVLGTPWDWEETCTEAIYGMGREIGGMLGGGDGCTGTYVAKALVTMGAVPRAFVGEYSGQRASQWGSQGVPQNVKDEAAKHKLGNAALITTTAELRAALSNGYAAAGGFSQGFTMTRDANGVCYESGSWGHEECIAGCRQRAGNWEYCMLQSWGPNVPDGPCTDDQPDFSFWIVESAAASILSQEDFYTFSGAAGFKKRVIPDSWKYSDFI